MNCADVESLILAGICQALPDKLQTEVEAHLKNCESCNGKWQATCQQLAQFRKVEPFAPPNLSAQAILKAAYRRAMWLRGAAWSVILLIFMALLWIGWLTTIYRQERILLSDLEKTIMMYRLETGNYPATAANMFQTLVQVASSKPYLVRLATRVNAAGLINDYWGMPLIYRVPGTHNPGFVDIYSFGRNQKDDQGKKDDIKNWSPATVPTNK
jgi:predicted anti-sigma-YlaC factor YlaD